MLLLIAVWFCIVPIPLSGSDTLVADPVSHRLGGGVAVAMAAAAVFVAMTTVIHADATQGPPGAMKVIKLAAGAVFWLAMAHNLIIGFRLLS